MRIQQLRYFSFAILSGALTACEGAFGWVYDEVAAEEVLPNVEPEIKETSVTGQFYVDASDWKMWYYLDLPAAIEEIRKDASHNINEDIVALSIPFEPTGDTETERGNHKRDGQYTYYFDVFNEGITNNHFSSFLPTSAQPEPKQWTIAIHRNNVRTNGLAAHETILTDIEEVTEDMCNSITAWQEDEWSENEVWDDQSTMLSCYVPCQGIKVNRVLSSWLTMTIPPMPPAFSMNNHVMLLRVADGTYAALQLMDYMNSTGKKCCLTIKYRYPI